MRKAPFLSIACVFVLFLCFLIPFFSDVPTASAEPAETDWSTLVPGVDYREGEVIVGFVDDATEETAAEVAEAYGFTLADIHFTGYPGMKRALFLCPEGVSVPDAIGILEKDPLVTYAEPNMIGHLFDPYGPFQFVFLRLAGSDRYETGAAITNAYGAQGGTVILATGEDFPDALCASALAGKEQAPILLTASSALSPATARVLAGIQPERIIVVGGTGAVPDSVLQSACDAAGITMDDVQRISGDNRYSTGLAIYEEGGLQGGDTCIIATGGNFADALSISPYAYASQTPIFLADPQTLKLDDETAAAIYGEFSQAVIVGGYGVVSDEAAMQIGIDTDHAARLYGYDRYGTSFIIAMWETGECPVVEPGTVYFGYKSNPVPFAPEVRLTMANVGLATGANFPDALTGGVLCGKNASVLYLVDEKVESYRGALACVKWFSPVMSNDPRKIQTGVIFGGTGALSDALKAEFDEALNEDQTNRMHYPYPC